MVRKSKKKAVKKAKPHPPAEAPPAQPAAKPAVVPQTPGAVYDKWIDNEPGSPLYQIGDHKFQKLDGSGKWLVTDKGSGINIFTGARYIGDVV